MYDYPTPPGFGDISYIYVYNGTQDGLADGLSYNQRTIQIRDGDFIVRAWAGADTILNHTGAVSTYGTIQLYDNVYRIWFNLPTELFSAFATGQSVVPEKYYIANAWIQFDFTNVELALDPVSNVVPINQLAFYGVRRNKGAVSDPAPSSYRYYDKPFNIQVQFPISANGTATGPGTPVQYTQLIQDYDFELRRMELSGIEGGKITEEAAQDLDFVAQPNQTATITTVLLLNSPLLISVVGNAITVTVASSGGGVLSTSTDVANLINSTAAAAALVVCTVGPGPAFLAPIGTASVGFSIIADPVAPSFAFTLYDKDWRARMNAPVNCNRIFHYPLATTHPMNSWPSPPILYPVNSVIRWDIASLIPSSATPSGGVILFVGVRRIPC